MGYKKIQSEKNAVPKYDTKDNMRKVCIRKCMENGNLKSKKRLTVRSNPIETAITSQIWDTFERKVFVSDELIRKKAESLK